MATRSPEPPRRLPRCRCGDRDAARRAGEEAHGASADHGGGPEHAASSSGLSTATCDPPQQARQEEKGEARDIFQPAPRADQADAGNLGEDADRRHITDPSSLAAYYTYEGGEGGALEGADEQVSAAGGADVAVEDDRSDDQFTLRRRCADPSDYAEYYGYESQGTVFASEEDEWALLDDGGSRSARAAGPRPPAEPSQEVPAQNLRQLLANVIASRQRQQENMGLMQRTRGASAGACGSGESTWQGTAVCF